MSQRVAFPMVLQSPVSGSALVGAKATLTEHTVGGTLGSGAPAPIYLTETGSTKVASNVIETDNTGRWTQGEAAVPAYAQYWLNEGTYDVLISGIGLKSVYVTRELISAHGVGAELLTLFQKPALVLEPNALYLARTEGIVNHKYEFAAFAACYLTSDVQVNPSSTAVQEVENNGVWREVAPASANNTTASMRMPMGGLLLSQGSSWRIKAAGGTIEKPFFSTLSFPVEL